MRLEDGMTLYHGTNARFEDIRLEGHTSKLKDFGEGFYLTSFFSQAEIHAHNRAAGLGMAYIYSYEVKGFNREDYTVRELMRYDEEWLNFLTQNRIYGRCDPNLDIVYDRLADNKWNVLTKKLRAYSKNQVEVDEVIRLISREEGAEGDQYCFKTEKALGLLVRVGCIAHREDGEGVWHDAGE